MGPGLSLKIWSNFQAKSQTTLVAKKNFFCLKWIWKHFKQLLNFSHFTQCKMCKVKYFTTRILRDLRFTTCKSKNTSRSCRQPVHWNFLEKPFFDTEICAEHLPLYGQKACDSPPSRKLSWKDDCTVESFWSLCKNTIFCPKLKNIAINKYSGQQYFSVTAISI